MAIRYVVVPPAVTPITDTGEDFCTLTLSDTEKNPDGSPVQVKKPIGAVTLYRYLTMYVFGEMEIDEKTGNAKHLKIGIGYDGNERMHTLGSQFKNAIPGETVPVSGEDHKTVEKIIREKKWSNSYLSQQFYELERAWMKAEDRPPATLETNGAPVDAAFSKMV